MFLLYFTVFRHRQGAATERERQAERERRAAERERQRSRRSKSYRRRAAAETSQSTAEIRGSSKEEGSTMYVTSVFNSHILTCIVLHVLVSHNLCAFENGLTNN